ncbi:S-adenosyl-L-methionine-dependent methyltransferase [Fennellomyces sp. T-0311]|nr:S-adenosyl-L-methionine-dependent methyltransferase [Fennellomyces sp. T-0311]
MITASSILPQKKRTVEQGACTTSSELSQHKYLLVNDHTEMERLIEQARVINNVSGSYFDSPIHGQLEKGINVLDSGCGPGVWILEMSAKYPQSTFYGVDIEPVYNNTIKSSNCKFSVHNILEPMPFPDNYFDFIHQQFLTAGIPAKSWPSLLTEMLRILKPGGWIELTEFVIMDIINCGPKLAVLNKCFNDRGSEDGIRFSLGRELEAYLMNAGVIDVTPRPMLFPMAHGGPDGQFWCENVMQIFSRQFRPAIVKRSPELEDPVAFENRLSEIREECAKNNVFMLVYRYSAQKPFGASSN